MAVQLRASGLPLHMGMVVVVPVTVVSVLVVVVDVDVVFLHVPHSTWHVALNVGPKNSCKHKDLSEPHAGPSS